MKSIHYAGEILMTGDAIADAVVQYAEALAKNVTSASIAIPVITSDGTLTEASFLLGPASQLVAVSLESDHVDPIDDELLAFIASAKAKLEGAPVGTGVYDEDPLDYDLRFDLGVPGEQL
jgi:hypothetical protein